MWTPAASALLDTSADLASQLGIGQSEGSCDLRGLMDSASFAQTAASEAGAADPARPKEDPKCVDDHGVGYPTAETEARA
jgi:hypothetical protein